jgi:hypothetical protein
MRGLRVYAFIKALTPGELREVLNALESSGVSGEDDEEDIKCLWRALSALSRPFSLARAPQVREGRLGKEVTYADVYWRMPYADVY